jgi:RNA polymerase sigma-70 factor, ECF subfamily
MSEHRKISLRAIAPPAVGKVISAPPVLIADENTIDYLCGTCGTVLLHADLGQVHNLVIHCAACGSYNSPAATMIEEGTWTVSLGLSRLPLVTTQATPDDGLIERIAAGSRLAMQVLFARHHVRVFRFVVGLVKDRTVAEDLIGDVFLDVWRHAPRFEARSAVATRLLAIAHYKALSALRSRRTHAPLDGAAEIVDAADRPKAVVHIKDRAEIIRACLETLSSEHREIIDLVYYHERSVDEVAEIVGIPLSTVKTRMFYARGHLFGCSPGPGSTGRQSDGHAPRSSFDTPKR